VGNFANGIGITGQLGSLNNVNMDISLPAGVSLDDFSGISVWCAIFLVDFSSGTFQ